MRMAGSVLACKPLTPARWEDFCAVMGPQGGCWGCWCMYWRAPRKDFTGPARKSFRARFKGIVEEGPPPGLLAYRGAEAVGWAQVGPRLATPNWSGARRLSAPDDPAEAEDPKIWAVTCFVVPRMERGQGVSRALLDGAIAFAKRRRARYLDACPVEPKTGKANPASLYHGVASIFAAAGFEEIARRRADRPLMRLDLRS